MEMAGRYIMVVGRRIVVRWWVDGLMAKGVGVLACRRLNMLFPYVSVLELYFGGMFEENDG